MANIHVDLESIRVTEGQGIGEGDFEMRVQAQEGNNIAVWPSATGFTRVEKGGVAHTIGRRVATYNVASGTLSKKFTIDVTEVDGGTLGGDDTGQSTLTFDLTPTMAPSTKSATISLHRPNMNFLGKVVVTMTAQRV
jgi:hypothetical protein